MKQVFSFHCFSDMHVRLPVCLKPFTIVFRGGKESIKLFLNQSKVDFQWLFKSVSI